MLRMWDIITMYQLPILVLLTLLIIIAIAVFSSSRVKNKRGYDPALNPSQSITQHLNRIESRIGALEQQLRCLPLLEQRLESLSNGDRSYELAQRLARQGTDVDQLIATCGLSKHEAQLVMQLYSSAPLPTP